ncbi:MAG: hypothetical protein GY777_15540 [Candidatus Brocadiaceae bacterium]|nr:hypothetical protein [Candidatus Brocadiaceae bacterium]
MRYSLWKTILPKKKGHPQEWPSVFNRDNYSSGSLGGKRIISPPTGKASRRIP